MTVVRVPRKPSSSRKTASLTLGLLASAAAMQSGNLASSVLNKATPVVEVATPVATSKRVRRRPVHRTSRRARRHTGGYNPQQKRSITHVFRFLRSCAPIEQRDALRCTAQSVYGAVQYNVSFSNALEAFQGDEALEIFGTDASVGEKLVPIIHNSAALQAKSVGVIPKLLKTLNKAGLQNGSQFTAQIDAFEAVLQQAKSNSLVDNVVEPQSIEQSQHFMDTRNEIQNHISLYTMTQRAEQKQRLRNARRSHNTREMADFFANQATSQLKIGAPAAREISTRSWRKYVSTIHRAYKAGTVRRSRFLDFCREQSGFAAAHEDQLRIITGMATISNCYHQAINPQSTFTRELTNKHKLWQPLVDYALPMFTKQAQRLVKSNIHPSLQEKYLSWLPLAEPAETNPLTMVNKRMTKIDDLATPLNLETAENGKTLERLLTVSADKVKETMMAVYPEFANRANVSSNNWINEWISGAELKSLNMAKLNAGNAVWEKVKVNDPASRVLARVLTERLATAESASTTAGAA